MSSVKEKPFCNTTASGGRYYSPNFLQDVTDKTTAWSSVMLCSILSIIFTIIGAISYGSTGFSTNTKIYVGLITITLVGYIYYYYQTIKTPSSWVKDCVEKPITQETVPATTKT